MAPNAIATVTPGLLTRHELINNTIVVATTPIAAAPEPMPDKEIAKAIPTVETGVIIIIEKAIAIKIAIGIGANLVNVSTRLPIQVVTSPTYGAIVFPTKPTPPPTIIGLNIIATEPNPRR